MGLIRNADGEETEDDMLALIDFNADNFSLEFKGRINVEILHNQVMKKEFMEKSSSESGVFTNTDEEDEFELMIRRLEDDRELRSEPKVLEEIVAGDIETDDEDEYDKMIQKAKNDREFVEEARKRGEIVDMLGADNGGYNYYVLYTPPLSAFTGLEDIVPHGWDGMDDESKEDDTVNMITPVVLEFEDDELVDESRKCQIETVYFEDLCEELDTLEIAESSTLKERIVIDLPPLEVYDPKAVPWNYGTNKVNVILRSEKCYASKE